jgi:hypothetical protein
VRCNSLSTSIDARLALMPYHRACPPGQAEIAAAGGAGRRPAPDRGQADESIARSAPLGAAASPPRGGHASARSDNEPASEAGGRMGVARGSTATPIVGVSPGGAQPSSRLAPMTLTQVSR